MALKPFFKFSEVTNRKLEELDVEPKNFEMKNVFLFFVTLILFTSCNKDETVAINEINIVENIIADQGLVKTVSAAMLPPPPTRERGMVVHFSEAGRITKIGLSNIFNNSKTIRVFKVSNKALIAEVVVANSGNSSMVVLPTPIQVAAGEKLVFSANSVYGNAARRLDNNTFLPYTKGGITIERTWVKTGPAGTFPNDNSDFKRIFGVPTFTFVAN